MRKRILAAFLSFVMLLALLPQLLLPAKAETLAEKAPIECDSGVGCPGRRFEDMPATTNWAHAGIDFVVANGLFAGISETAFGPGQTMTRGMLLSVLWRLEGKPEETARIEYSDVEFDMYYATPVAWATNHGIVNGIGNNKFAPKANITREQMATILYRYSHYKGYDVTARADLSKFPDAKQVSEYARTPLSWANAKGLISGDLASDGTAYLKPRGNATRAQVASILMRFINKIVNADEHETSDVPEGWHLYPLKTSEIKLYIPDTWNGKYLITENTYDGIYSVGIHSKMNYDKNYCGQLAEIKLSNYQTESEVRDPIYDVIGRWSGGLVIVTYASDVQYDTTDEACKDEYEFLEADLQRLISQIVITTD